MAKLSPVGAARSYFRKYPLAPRYRPEESLTLTAADGTRLCGARITGPAWAPATVVLVHGFVNWSRTPNVHAFAQMLAQRVDVVVPDLRGHGRSGGLCTLGRDEPLDVAAAVAACDPDKPVVTAGISLGGAAVLMHAGRFPGSVAGVVAISSPAFWGGIGTAGARQVERWIGTARGRLVLRTLLRTRLAGGCPEIPDASELAPRIAPAFTVIVADPHDWYFGPEHPDRLYRSAAEPKELWWYPGGGHGTDLLTADLAARLLATVEARVAAPPQPAE